MKMTRVRKDSPRRTIYTLLLSICLFLGVVCAVLLVCLVLIGKNLALQARCKGLGANSNSNVNLSDILVSDKTLRSVEPDEISVKINVGDLLSTHSYSNNNNLLVSSSSNNNNNDYLQRGWRLPRDVSPQSYDVTIDPDLQTGLFSGKNNISIVVKDRRDHLIVHSYLLNITNVSVQTSGGEFLEILDYHEDKVHQLQVVDLEDPLQPGVYYLYFEFSGEMREKIVGIYSSVYYDGDGNKRYMLVLFLKYLW